MELAWIITYITKSFPEQVLKLRHNTGITTAHHDHIVAASRLGLAKIVHQRKDACIAGQLLAKFRKFHIQC